ncbi:hypothetical protein B6I21_00600 [candidate division KSB1 bacterium 4572_119]|nr:MAG: hypothetical protein B6I21_00600 [candidate division KSB1 bacterium 4572_119]
MKNQNLHMLLKQIILLLVILPFSLSAQVYKQFSNPNLDFKTKLKSCLQYAVQETNHKKAWLVYQIYTSNDPFINNPTLKSDEYFSESLDVLILNNSNSSKNKYDRNSLLNQPSNIFTKQNRSIKKSTKTGTKPVKLFRSAIIFDCFLESGFPRIHRVYYQRMEQAFSKEKRPIFWLGVINTTDSFNSLANLYNKTKHSKLKQQIIPILGIHPTSSNLINFAKDELRANNSANLKSAIINLLGNSTGYESIKLLTNIAFKISNIEIRKKAVQALGQIGNPLAFSALKMLATRKTDLAVRKEAIFWISQFGYDQSIQILKQLVTSKNQAISEYTVFAISQIPENRGTPLLALIAKKSPNPKLREKAIFWMGQSKDQKEIDLLIDVFNGIENE